MELGKAIENGTHQIDILIQDELPNCLLTHISTANHSLIEPFSRLQINEYITNIAYFLNDMTENRGRLNYSWCETLLEFMDIVPEPNDILEYRRINN